VRCLLASFVLAATASAVAAQQSLTTTFANNNGGGAGGAVYFTLTAGSVDVTVTNLDFHFSSAAGSVGSIDIYTTPGTHAGNELNMALWANVASCPIAASNAAGTPTNGVLSAPLVILAGTSIGVAYTDSAVTLAHAYTSGTAPFPLSYVGCALTLDAGTASNTPFSGGLFSPRVVNTTVHYAVAGVCAKVESIGLGCATAFASAYEATTLDVFATTNTMVGLDFISTGSGYVVTPSAGVIASIGSLDPLAVPVAGVGDDAVVPVGTLGLEFGSNGWLAMGAGNSNQWIPTPAIVLNQAATQFSCWADLQPNTGGTITYEELGSQAVLTYDAVLSWGTTDVNTFQFAIDTASGNVSLYFGAMASATAHPMILGYSPAGPNADPGSVGIEAELIAKGAIVLEAGDTIPLQLEAMNRPVQGATAVNWDVTTSNIDAGAAIHIGILGLSNPALPLSGIGLPSACTQYASDDVLLPPAIVTGMSSFTWTALVLPALSPSFAGFEFYVQSGTLGSSSPLLYGEGRASNGIKATVGTL
jgi:hypothetical protein